MPLIIKISCSKLLNTVNVLFVPAAGIRMLIGTVSNEEVVLIVACIMLIIMTDELA